MPLVEFPGWFLFIWGLFSMAGGLLVAGFGRWIMGSSSWSKNLFALIVFLACLIPGSFFLATGFILLQLAIAKTFFLGTLWVPFVVAVPAIAISIRFKNKSQNNLWF